MARRFWALIVFTVVLTLSANAGVVAPAALARAFSPAGGITVAFPEAPDLIVDSVTLSPENPCAGDKVTFRVTVRNDGVQDAGASRLDCYMDGALAYSVDLAPIDAGEAAVASFTWKAAAGTHTIETAADTAGWVVEEDEANNSFLLTFPVAAPDLVVEEITWLPETSSAGDKVTFGVTVKNRGGSIARYSNVELLIDGISRGTRGVPRLEAGANVTATFYWPAQAGTHEVEAVADVLGQVDEGDETNNTATVDYATLAADLIIREITWSPEEPEYGDNITMTVTVENAGEGRSYSSHVDCYIDGGYLDSGHVGPLAPGGTVEKTFAWITDLRAHDFTAVADADEEIVESDETNNSSTVTLPGFSVERPDLVVKGVSWSPSNPLATQGVTFTVNIKNQGDGAAAPSVVYFYMDSRICQADVAALDAGDNVTREFIWTARAGRHAFKAVVDALNHLAEESEANNEKEFALSPLAPSPPDLAVSGIVWSPESPLAGDAVTFTVSTENRGAGLAESSTLALYVDDALVGSFSLGSLGTAATATSTVSWEAQPGEHVVRAVADVTRLLEETDEVNNAVTANLSVAAPDLVIRDFAWVPEEPEPGNTVNLSITLENSGSYQAGSSYVGYFIDGLLRGSQYVGGLEAGASVEKRFSWIAPEGSYTFAAVADMQEEVTELDEGNNEKSATIAVADLVAADISWSPEGPEEGEAVTFSFTLGNQGSGAAGNVHAVCYIDGSRRECLTFDVLEAGEALAGGFSWQAVSGTHTVRVIADEADDIMERDETNNVATVTFTVTAAPVDVAVTSPPADDGLPEAEEALEPSVPVSTVVADAEASEPPASVAAGTTDSETADALADAAPAQDTRQGTSRIWWMMVGAAVAAVFIGGIVFLVVLAHKPRRRREPAASHQAAE